MKKIIYLICILSLIHCSAPKNHEAVVDSTALSSSSVSAADASPDNSSSEEVAEVIDMPDGDSLANIIDMAVSELSSYYASGGNFYTITSSASRYESGYETTWYYDSAFQLKYGNGSWDMEGTSGSYSYYFKDEELIASVTEDDYQSGSEATTLHSGFKPIYGFKKTYGSEEEANITYLTESDFTSSSETARQELFKLINYIRDNLDSATYSDQQVSIHIETVTNYGVDFTSKEDYSISKALFDKLIKN